MRIVGEDHGMPSTVLKTDTQQAAANLATLSSEVTPDALPSTEWMTRLRLHAPRKDVKCLTEPTRLAKRIT